MHTFVPHGYATRLRYGFLRGLLRLGYWLPRFTSVAFALWLLTPNGSAVYLVYRCVVAGRLVRSLHVPLRIGIPPLRS